MDYEKTHEEIQKTLTELIEENKTVPVIVEGAKDIDALRKLGLTGEIIRFNQGMSIPDFCDMIAERYSHIILLTDWDRKGGYLCTMLKKNLENRTICNTYHREIFAKKSIIKTVEGLPSWIDTIQQKIRIN